MSERVEFSWKKTDRDGVFEFRGRIELPHVLRVIQLSRFDELILDGVGAQSEPADVLLCLEVLYRRWAEHQLRSADPSMGQGVGRLHQERERP